MNFKKIILLVLATVALTSTLVEAKCRGGRCGRRAYYQTNYRRGCRSGRCGLGVHVYANRGYYAPVCACASGCCARPNVGFQIGF